MARKRRKPKVLRSGFEDTVAAELKAKKVKFGYETLKIKYEIPSKMHTYTPDFVLDNGVIIEAKGKFDAASRKKMLLVKQQWPDLDIKMLFMRDNKIAKNSNTYYSEWCEKNDIDYAVGGIPDSWLNSKR